MKNETKILLFFILVCFFYFTALFFLPPDITTQLVFIFISAVFVIPLGFYVCKPKKNTT
ncbi:hypothetical protein MsAm2_15090 [Methanolapillus ohkumae]|uniref:Uncharacterized protein n=1 Tax=Methanolapillus ohkumae TaxID=3028298 RepID=A0AA96V7Q4_9EURY|nr:hypothetical protein MsAm2_15090 [Methanosarcinaceae archaeon Am2]